MNPERVFTILHGPHVSEKAAMASDAGNQVVFRVALDANKQEIKKAVEQLFDVKVRNVQVAVVKGKVKRNRFGASRKPGWKKAYVRLEQGQDIDFAIAP